MYICPICSREFVNSNEVAKHSLKCWKEQNPYHKSTPAPRGETVVTRKVDPTIANFFAALQGG